MYSACLVLQSAAQFLCELTVIPLDLILGDDDLARVDIIGVGNGMVQDADGSDHLTVFSGAIHSIAGVADKLFALGKLLREKAAKVHVSRKLFNS